MIVLVGFMGAGKTSVGRPLARRLGRVFVDSDEAIADATGEEIPELFQTMGEPGFRDIEAAQILELLDGPEVVLALGGGALSSAAVREALRGHQVVLLDISLTEALARIGGDAGRPMLARPDLAAIYAQRQDHYRQAASIVVPVDGRHLTRVVKEVLSAVGAADVEE